MSDTIVTAAVKEETPATAPVVTDKTEQVAPNAAAPGAEKPTEAAPKDKDGKTDDKPKGAPESYKDFAIPEGMEFDKERASKFTEVAKKANLDQDTAQAFVDLYATAVKETAEAQAKMWADTQNNWANESKSDKEFGGVKFNENISVAKKALDKFGTPELIELADSYGMGNHPEFIRLLYRVGKAMSEDKFVVGAGGTGGPKDPAKVLFPDMN